jgi:type IV secretion system protein VirD4
MIEEGGEVVAQLVGRFVREYGHNELAGIQSDFDTQTRFLLSPPIARDLEKGDWSFRQLRERPTTVYIVLPPNELTRKRRLTRLLLTDALCEHFRPGPVNTLFILDEYRAAVSDMTLVNDVWALVRGYGVTLMPILQSALQLQAMLKDEWENFAAQAGVTLTIGPPGDLFTAKWMSERCGVTTVAQAGFNQGDGVNSGGGVNAGTGTSGSGFSSNQGSGENFGRNMSGGLSLQQTERRAFLPQELMDMKAGECRAWLPGFGSKSVPLFAPNFWNRKADWVERVRPNPYRKG